MPCYSILKNTFELQENIMAKDKRPPLRIWERTWEKLRQLAAADRRTLVAEIDWLVDMENDKRQEEAKQATAKE